MDELFNPASKNHSTSSFLYKREGFDCWVALTIQHIQLLAAISWISLFPVNFLFFLLVHRSSNFRCLINLTMSAPSYDHSTAPGPWSTGLWDCFADKKTCKLNTYEVSNSSLQQSFLTYVFVDIQCDVLILLIYSTLMLQVACHVVAHALFLAKLQTLLIKDKHVSLCVCIQIGRAHV